MRHIQRHALALMASALTSSMAVAQPPPRQGPPPRPAPGAPQAGAPHAGAPPAGAPSDQRRQMAQGQNRPTVRRLGAEGRRSGPGGSPAAMLLRMRTPLKLTDDQVKRLETLAAAPQPTRNEAAMLRARADLIDANAGDGDLARIRAALDKMSRLRNDHMLAQMKSRHDVRGVLTAAQTTTLDNLRGEMRGEMRERARGMGPEMRDGPDHRGRRGDGRDIEQHMERDVIIERRRTPPPAIDSPTPRYADPRTTTPDRPTSTGGRCCVRRAKSRRQSSQRATATAAISRISAATSRRSSTSPGECEYRPGHDSPTFGAPNGATEVPSVEPCVVPT